MSDSIIVNGNKVEGKISAKTDLHIEGEVIGEITSEASVYIAKSGIVKADIFAVNVYISGKFDGSVDSSEFTHVYSGAYVTGSIKTPSLEFEKGAKFSGDIDMGLEKDIPVTEIKSIINEEPAEVPTSFISEEIVEIVTPTVNEEPTEIATPFNEGILPVSDDLEPKVFAQEETSVDIDVSSVNMIDDKDTIKQETPINDNSIDIAPEKYQEKISAMELTEVEEV